MVGGATGGTYIIIPLGFMPWPRFNRCHGPPTTIFLLSLYHKKDLSFYLGCFVKVAVTLFSAVRETEHWFSLTLSQPVQFFKIDPGSAAAVNRI